jgi:hypothetical protein
MVLNDGVSSTQRPRPGFSTEPGSEIRPRRLPLRTKHARRCEDTAPYLGYRPAPSRSNPTAPRLRRRILLRPRPARAHRARLQYSRHLGSAPPSPTRFARRSNPTAPRLRCRILLEPPPARAHRVRLQHSCSPALHRLRPRGSLGDRTLPLRACDAAFCWSLHPLRAHRARLQHSCSPALHRHRPRGSLGDRTLPLRACDAAFFWSRHPPGLTEPGYSIPATSALHRLRPRGSLGQPSPRLWRPRRSNPTALRLRRRILLQPPPARAHRAQLQHSRSPASRRRATALSVTGL